MTESVAHPIICPIIIGRDAQRTVMAQLLDRAHSEQGQTLLLAGEAGIGKSRLVAELTQQAAQQGIRVVTGRSFETDSTIPCALLADLLRARFATRPPAEFMQEVGPSAGELVKLLPDLHTMLAATTPFPSSAAEPEKRRLFEALYHCFVHPPVPTLIIVEDAHWCDNTSLDFLLFAARKIVAYPILLVITYRNDEVNTALARLLAAFDRERLANEITLSRLTKQQTEAMLRAIFTLPRPAQEDFLDALYALTEGNPFFIEEVLKSCVASGDIFQVGGQWGRKLLSQLHIPRTVQVAVRQRIEQLPATTQQLLKIAAVAGQRFDFSLLQQVSKQEEIAIVESLKQLMAAQLVVEESAERFAFRHALTRQAVYFELLARERRSLHQVVAETLEEGQRHGEDGRLPEVAYHYYTAGDWGKTWEYARQAGEQAQSLYAPRAATIHYGYALEALQHLIEQGSDGERQSVAVAIHRARGRAYETLGEFEAAQSDLEKALALARGERDSKAEWQSLLDLGFLWTSRDFGLAGEYFQQALMVARSLGNPAIVAQSLNRLGNWYVNNEQPHLGESYHAEALAVFQAQNDQTGVAATLDLLAGATHLAGNPQQSHIYYEQSSALFRKLKEQRGLTSALTWLTFRGPIAINMLAPAALLPECAKRAEEALMLAREIHWRPGELFAMVALGFALGAQGEYGKALAHLDAADTFAQEIDHRWDTVAYIALGTIYLDLGILTTAQEYFERGRLIAEEHHILFSRRIATALLAATFLAQNQVAQAKTTLVTAFGEATATLPLANEPAPTLAQRLYWLVYAEVALHENKAGDALAIVEQLLASTGDDGSKPDKAVPRLLIVYGKALLALKRIDEAEEALQRAQEATDLQGARPLVWRIQLLLGDLYRSQGWRNQAERQYTAARTSLDALAETLPATPLREQFLYNALAIFPAPPVLTPLRARKQSVDGLTAREVEVASLIQQGKSDREIAETLSLSTRTVSTHVGNILAKLEFSSRAQIAAWAVTKSL